MAGSDFVFNIAKGKVKYYCELPASADALIVVILRSTNLEADATLKDYDDLSALLAGTSDEATNTGYARKTISSSVTITVDDTNDRVDIDVPDQVWTTVLAGDNWAKALFCYDGDTGAGTDANITPLTAHSFDVTTDGTDITAVIAASGFFRAA